MLLRRASVILVAIMLYSKSPAIAAPYSQDDLVAFVNYLGAYERETNAASPINTYYRVVSTATTNGPIMTIATTSHEGNYDQTAASHCTTGAIIETFTFNIHDVDNIVQTFEIPNGPPRGSEWAIQIWAKNRKYLIHQIESGTKPTCPGATARVPWSENSTFTFVFRVDSKDVAERFAEMAKSAWN